MAWLVGGVDREGCCAVCVIGVVVELAGGTGCCCAMGGKGNSDRAREAALLWLA